MTHTEGNAVVVPALARAPSSVACLRSLGRRNVPTIAVSEHEHSPGLHSKYAEETHTVPDPTDDVDAYADALLSLAARDNVVTIIPVREVDTYVLAKYRREFGEHVETVWPTLDTLRGVQDRVRLFDAADAADVGAPETGLLDEWDDWSEEVIVKPRFTLNAAEYHDSFEETHRHQTSTQYVPAGEEPDIDSYLEDVGHVPLVQEYVRDSDEYAFFALCDHGEPVASFQHQQLRGYRYSGGASAYRKAIDDPELEAAGRRLLGELDWHGLAMVEFLKDPATGEYRLMEINPRFWTSLPFTVQAGVDLPYYYWLLAVDAANAIQSGYDVGARGHLLRGEALFLHSVLTEDNPLAPRPSLAGSMLEVAYTVARYPRFDNFSLDDPGPFVQDVKNSLEELLAGRTS
ncbi:ATP-grasp domain-containing protein [Halobacterium zhouii]|uniref:carboxylate--amine ligase n=1 Tax=Halobacterium zhouii TaxID=2902624 RepID=UPI001E5F01D9|nr:ATP-grasp domain-containing protein [Halobacterium zhouii]